ncbi:MAG: hypothetical protein P8J87_16425 [Verrucomicrobiales bacterium]|nr:hypothetical protein [Verrucomicrobiales bacterium]
MATTLLSVNTFLVFSEPGLTKATASFEMQVAHQSAVKSMKTVRPSAR